MRLWHVDILGSLPKAQLMGQHRECCALRGKGWGKRHSMVDYVFTNNPLVLVDYHRLVINRLRNLGVNIDMHWWELAYRGPNNPELEILRHDRLSKYIEHNLVYLLENILNLESKNINIGINPEDLIAEIKGYYDPIFPDKNIETLVANYRNVLEYRSQIQTYFYPWHYNFIFGGQR